LTLLVQGQEEEEPSCNSCVKYGDVVFLQNNYIDNRWLLETTGTAYSAVTLDITDDFQNSIRDQYQWTILGPSSSTPKTGCIKYGDPFRLGWQSNGGGILYGASDLLYRGAAGDLSLDALGTQMVFHSEFGSGADPDTLELAHGKCVKEYSVVYIQNLHQDLRWVGVVDIDDGNGLIYAFTANVFPFKQDPLPRIFQWIVRPDSGTGPRTAGIICAGVGAEGYWTPFVSANVPGTTYTITEGITRTDTQTVIEQDSWSTSITQTISAGFKIKAVDIGSETTVTGELSGSLTTSIQSAVTRTSTKTKTFTFPDAGTIWQFQFRVDDVCVSDWFMDVDEVVFTKNVEEPPCCLPGQAKDPNVYHGPCITGAICLCGPDICEGMLFESK
jgi:hypothetical protein